MELLLIKEATAMETVRHIRWGHDPMQYQRYFCMVMGGALKRSEKSVSRRTP